MGVLMFVRVIMMMFILVVMIMIMVMGTVRVSVAMGRMGMLVMMVSVFIMVVIMMMILFQMDVEFHPFDCRFRSPRNVKVVIVELEFFQFVLELLEINTEVEHGADEHVATYSTEDIQIESLH